VHWQKEQNVAKQVTGRISSLFYACVHVQLSQQWDMTNLGKFPKRGGGMGSEQIQRHGRKNKKLWEKRAGSCSEQPASFTLDV